MPSSFSATIQFGDVRFLTHTCDSGESPDIIHFHETNGIELILIGRLYYHEDLINRCRIPALDPRKTLLTTNPAALALVAYQHFGTAMFDFLEGEYALCLRDRSQQIVLAARDPMGNYPLFWKKNGTELQISSSLRPLLRGGIPELDMEYMADTLAAPMPFQEIRAERTAYQGIQQLPDGCWLRAVVEPSQVCAPTVQRYWYWEDQVRDRCGPSTEQDMASIFREVLVKAIRERMVGRVCAHLSGGIDSTSLAMLAGAEQAKQGKEQLRTLSVVYSKMAELAKERQYIDLALKHRDYFEPIFVDGDDLLDFDNFRNPPPHEQPYAGLWRSTMDGTTVAAAKQAGCHTMFSGIGADEIADMLPFHLADLISKRRWTEATREAGRWARHFGTDHWTVIRTFGLQPLISRAGLGGMAAWLSGGGRGWRQQSEWSVAPWLDPSFSHQHDLRGRIIQAMKPPGHPYQNQNVRSLIGMIHSRVGDNNRWIFGIPSGVHVCHPFLDTRLLRFGLSYQSNCRPEPGLKKPLITGALGDDLPSGIRLRRSKGDFNEILYMGLSRNLPILMELIESSAICESGIVDKSILADCLQKAAVGNADGIHGFHKMSITLAVMKWQSQHVQWQRDWERVVVDRRANSSKDAYSNPSHGVTHLLEAVA